MRLLTTAIFLLILSSLSAQQRIDGMVHWGSDEQKLSYSIYIPTSYNDNFPSPLIVAVPPVSSRWNPRTWRERLSRFSEKNGMILLCPERSETDVAFMEVLLDSVNNWLRIDPMRVYGVGDFAFPTEVYDHLKGTIVFAHDEVSANSINAAITENTNQAFIILSSVPRKNFQELPNDRVKFEFLRSVNQSMSFQFRDQILSEALSWLEAMNFLPQKPLNRDGGVVEAANKKVPERDAYSSKGPSYSGTMEEVEMSSVKWYGQSFISGEPISIRTDYRILSVAVYNNFGKLVRIYDTGTARVATNGWRSGSYIMRVNTTAGMETHVVRLN